jgi:Flp pilus assembly pilin Flp
MFNYVVARVVTLMNDRKGVTTLEYAVIAAVTVVATGAAFAIIGGDLTAVYTGVENALKPAA